MPKYKYKATGSDGQSVEGVADAKDKFDLAKQMRMEGKNLLTATEESSGTWNMDKINAFLSSVKLEEKIIFAHNLSIMLEAGLPVARALQIIQKQTKNPKLIEIFRSLVDDIQKGNQLSVGLERFPKIFPPVMTAMIRAGEESGGLVDALNVVGGQMEKTYTLRKKIRGAMMYPAIVFCVMIAVGVLMMLYVVPGLAVTFKDVGQELPPLTRGVMAISDFLQFHGFFAFLIAVGVGFLGWLYQRSEFGSKSIDWLATRVPLFGEMVKEYNAAIVTRTLSSLISAGVDIVRTLSITKDVAGNSYYKISLDEAAQNVQKGIPLSQVFVKYPDIYPIMVGDMMEVGEETGKLSDMLKKIATFYENEVDTATSDMSKLLEPILMTMIAGFVGIFAYAMIAPMYSVLNSI